MIGRFATNRAALASFPKDLLDGSREAARMADRIVRQLGFSDVDCESFSDSGARLVVAPESAEEHPFGRCSG